jgi:hypothetical protein
MDTYELQVYQNGGWQFDSYYDSKDIVLSEAKRVDEAGRYLGVRVLEERFNEERQSSSYATIFSRLKKNDEIGGSPSQGPRAGTVEAAASGAVEKKSGRARKSKKKGGNVTWLLMGGIIMVVIGIGMILVLREYAGSI